MTGTSTIRPTVAGVEADPKAEFETAPALIERLREYMSFNGVHPRVCTDAAAMLALALRRLEEARRDALEEAAKICDEPINHQHPLKPLGVIMSVTPASPAHAAAIRAMLNKDETK